MLKKRGLSITKYTVEAAIKDAIQYHNHCSLNDGLVHAAKSIERAENPGLKAAKIGLFHAKEIQLINKTNSLEALQKIKSSLPSYNEENGLPPKGTFALEGDFFDLQNPMDTHASILTQIYLKVKAFKEGAKK